MVKLGCLMSGWFGWVDWVDVFGGVDELGGNKILLEDKGTKVLFDFCEFFFWRWLLCWLASAPRLGDYFQFDLLPRIKGLYSKEQLASTDLAYAEPEISAVFVSHAHFDHINHLQFLDPAIPVYMGVGTKLFMESMEETSSFCDYGEHCCNRFRTGDKIKVDGLVVEPMAVDHSIPAAYGFIIPTSAGPVVYTGDPDILVYYKREKIRRPRRKRLLRLGT